MITDIPNQPLRITRGQDVTIEVRVRVADVTIRVTADAAAGATSVSIDRDHAALADGDMLILGEHVVIEVNATCAAGATSLTTTALPGPLKPGDLLQLLADMTSATVEVEVLTNADDATPVKTLSGASITIPTQSSTANRGKVQATLLAADTASLGDGPLYFAVWRRNSGSSRPQADGTFEIVPRGFVA